MNELGFNQKAEKVMHTETSAVLFQTCNVKTEHSDLKIWIWALKIELQILSGKIWMAEAVK